MKVWQYTAINEDQKVLSGTLPWSDQLNLELLLEAKRLRLISYKVVEANRPKRLTYEALLMIVRSLKCYLRSGVSIADAMDYLIAATVEKHTLNVLRHISHQLRSGEMLSAAIQSFLPLRDMVSFSLLRMAESTGSYEEVLDDIEEYIQWQLTSYRQVSEAMRYPWIVLGVTWVALFCMLYVFTPQLGAYLQQVGGEIPATTQGLLWLSECVVEWPITWFVFPIVVIALVRFLPKLNALFKSIMMRIPKFRDLVLAYVYSICFRVIALQLKHGYTLVEAMQGLRKVQGEQKGRLALEIDKLLRHVMLGVPLSDALRQYPRKFVMPLVVQLVQVGEQSNTLGENLEQLSTHYADALQRQTKNLMKLIEPMLLLAIGGVLVLFVVGLFFPLYQQMGAVFVDM